jgi:hypothetical protein
MKTKCVPVLVFTMVFFAVAVLSHSSAGAWDRLCADTAYGECFKVPNLPGTGPGWTLKAFVGFKPGNTTEEIPVELGVNWPICDSANNRSIFRYISGATVPLTNISTQSYIVFNWPAIPLGGTPPGAQLSLDKLFEDCKATVSSGDVAWKLNTVVSNKKDGIIDIYMPLGTRVNTNGFAWIKWSSYCAGGPMWVAQDPGTGELLPQETTRTFANCGANNSVTVKFNKCGQIETVTCANGRLAVPAAAPRLCESTEIDVGECIEYPNMGPRAGGAVICTTPPVYAYGRQMWFCPK